MIKGGVENAAPPLIIINYCLLFERERSVIHHTTATVILSLQP